MANENNTADRELFMSRTIRAPRSMVYHVWTTPEHMALWWEPNGFKNTIHEMEVKEGGHCRYTMHGPDGVDYPNYMKYTEVIPNEKLVYLHGEDEHSVDAVFHVTATFEEDGEDTIVTMRLVFPTAEEKRRVIEEFGAEVGQMQHFNCLEDYIAFQRADSMFTISREFDVPVELLYEVHTQKEHIMNYWGPKESETELIEFDFQTGGRLFYCMHMPQGKFYAQQIYREIVANRKLTMMTTFCNENGEAIYPPVADNLPLYMLNSMEFEMIDENKSKLTINVVPFNATAVEHQTFLDSKKSMHDGYGGTMDVMEEYIKTLKK